jgi:hypothetical protein
VPLEFPENCDSVAAMNVVFQGLGQGVISPEEAQACAWTVLAQDRLQRGHPHDPRDPGNPVVLILPPNGRELRRPGPIPEVVGPPTPHQFHAYAPETAPEAATAVFDVPRYPRPTSETLEAVQRATGEADGAVSGGQAGSTDQEAIPGDPAPEETEAAISGDATSEPAQDFSETRETPEETAPPSPPVAVTKPDPDLSANMGRWRALAS